MYRMGSTIQPGHVDCFTLDLPPWIWKPSLFRAICSVDFPSFLRYHGRHDPLARYVPLIVLLRGEADDKAYFRYYKTAYSSTALARSKKNARVNQSGYDFATLKLVSTHFTGRLVGTTTGWLFNDFLFYGNKLFAGSFIKVISPGAGDNVMTGWLWNLVNIGVSLCGYYLAAFLIDHKFYGRKRMQTVGFLADAVLFLIPASKFPIHLRVILDCK
jgi:hypothetical protein